MPSKEPSQTRPATARSTQRATPSRLRKPRKKRRDAGTTRFVPRDRFALLWIGHQYGIRLDHLQWLLGRYRGRRATYNNWISESAARDVVNRWEQEGWLRVARLQVNSPFWVWLSRKGLRKMGLAYAYRDLEQSSLDDLQHLYAINAIRLYTEMDDPEVRWTSERELLRGQVRLKGNLLLHRPDGVAVFPDGLTVAIEAELSTKKPWALAEILLELLRGEDYLHAKVQFEVPAARTMTRRAQSRYDQTWYFAPTTIRTQLRRARARLLADDVIREEEAKRLYIYWYPLATTEEELAQEEQEEDEALGLV
jgi:hypothetical protein